MSGLFDQLSKYAASKEGAAPPKNRRDLWELALRAEQLERVVELLAAELETFKTSAQTEIDRLRMKVEVLEAHEARGGKSHG